MLQEQIPGNDSANYPALGQPIDELALAEIKGAILAKLRLAIGKDTGMATKRDWYKAAALALRDRIVHRWLMAEKQNYDAGRKRVYYLSLEFLIGRLFTDALNNMGLLPVFESALGDLGVDLSELRKLEPDAALGNGGLGRLAACFMESMATLAIPAIGYGIRYDFGLFRQIIQNGWQQEYPDEWLSFGNPWEFQRPEVVYQVYFGGHIEHVDDHGRDCAIWHPGETISVSIGQGAIEVTPIQMAMFAAAIGNGGTLYRPHLLLSREVREGIEEDERQDYVIRRVELRPRTLEVIRDAMWGVVNEDGTGGRAKIAGRDICAKTGTAQVFRASRDIDADKLPKDKRDHAWFVGFAPKDNPRIAWAVFVQNGGHGGTTAAPIARAVLERFFQKLDSRQGVQQLASVAVPQ